MTNNLFPLPYWAPALQRVPIPLKLLNAAYESGERPCQGVPFHACDKAMIEQRVTAVSGADRTGRRVRRPVAVARCG